MSVTRFKVVLMEHPQGSLVAYSEASALESKLGESQEQRGRANDELQRLQSVNELLKASLKRSEGQVAEYALRLDSIRAETIQECWDAINKHIPRGTLASIYENESRNGMVLATNILSALKATVVERHERNCCEWHKAGGDLDYPCNRV